MIVEKELKAIPLPAIYKREGKAGRYGGGRSMGAGAGQGSGTG